MNLRPCPECGLFVCSELCPLGLNEDMPDIVVETYEDDDAGPIDNDSPY